MGTLLKILGAEPESNELLACSRRRKTAGLECGLRVLGLYRAGLGILASSEAEVFLDPEEPAFFM